MKCNQEERQMYLQLQTNVVLVVSGRTTNTHAHMTWLVFGNGNNWHFQQFLQHHVHDYYQFERLQCIYDNNIFPGVHDQIWYDGITQPPSVWKKQAGCPKKKWFRKQSKFLDPGDSPIICSLCGKSGHNWTTCPRADMATEAEQQRNSTSQEQILDQLVKMNSVL